MLIVTNFHSFPTEWVASGGDRGSSVPASTVRDFAAYANFADAVYLVNCDPRLTLQLAIDGLRHTRPPLVAVDIVLRRPASLAGWIKLPAKRFLLSRVDHYIHYFRDLRGYESVFGIGPGRSSFVPFKVNLATRHQIQPEPEGEYVLCFGRSLRDFDTFFAAVETLPYPAAIAQPDKEAMRQHQARFTRSIDALPSNVRILEDNGSEDSQIRILRDARLVVLPILKTSMVASGISTGLNAMMLGKCVIGSEGPGMSDVFTNGEVLTCTPEDPQALAAVIRQAWEQDELRRQTAAAGHRYALAAGGEQELYARIIDRVVDWRKRGPS